YSFLTDETSKLEDKIVLSSKKIAKFKEKFANSLPEMLALNLSMLNRTESELDSVDSELRALRERQFYLQSQLTQINPLTNMRSATGEPILDPASRLKALESEFVSLSARYSSKHPDIVKIQREIEGLRQFTNQGTNAEEQAKALTTKRGEYSMLVEKYSENHPDVISLKLQIESLEASIAALPPEAIEKQVMTLQPDNPAYIAVQTQLKTIATEIVSNEARKKRLDKKMDNLDKQISMSPQVEKNFNELTREKQSEIGRFQDIKARQMEAEIGQQLENERKGESFILIDPAQFPEKPIKPNRIAIILLSFIFSIAVGLGVALLKEVMDDSIRGVVNISKLLTEAPLAVIPIIYNTIDLQRQKRNNRIMLGSVIGSIIAVTLLIHVFWTPLDVLWFRGLRKAQNVIDI
ncbi:hypothetical protein MNBD_GAMMA07-2172, partial [hydrothermal vent metagenome]